MANMGVKDSNGSQFFFSMRGDDMQHLDGKHTVFAKARGFILRLLSNRPLSLYLEEQCSWSLVGVEDRGPTFTHILREIVGQR